MAEDNECQLCGALLDDADDYCPECGADVE
ncbi:MAG: zinc-ribbon domain-containing protein [Nanoarchaeota archaeon]|nr:zinc-ribbon domain-containing protein [Nanoarchaeota archaeon]